MNLAQGKVQKLDPEPKNFDLSNPGGLQAGARSQAHY